MTNETYKAGWGYDVRNMRKALNSELHNLDRQEDDLRRELLAIETARAHLTHAAEGLSKLEAAEIAAMEPTHEHYNYVDFLQWVATENPNLAPVPDGDPGCPGCMNGGAHVSPCPL